MIYEIVLVKINFMFDIFFKRDDGYYEIEMVMIIVDLNDWLFFEKWIDNKIVVDIEYNYVFNDNKNFVYKVVDLMFERFNINEGVIILIDKDILVLVGFVGGFVDVVVIMRGLNWLFGLG